MLRLCSLDLSGNKLLKSGPGFVRSGLNLLLRRALHRSLVIREVLSMSDRNEVFELGLNIFARTLALVSNNIITNIAFAIDLKSKRIACGSLQVLT
jgi:hypothetical protein